MVKVNLYASVANGNEEIIFVQEWVHLKVFWRSSNEMKIHTIGSSKLTPKQFDVHGILNQIPIDTRERTERGFHFPVPNSPYWGTMCTVNALGIFNIWDVSWLKYRASFKIIMLTIIEPDILRGENYKTYINFNLQYFCWFCLLSYLFTYFFFNNKKQ